MGGGGGGDLKYYCHLPSLEPRRELEPKCVPAAIVYGFVTGNAPVSYWATFPAVSSNSVKVNFAQFFLRFLTGECIVIDVTQDSGAAA